VTEDLPVVPRRASTRPVPEGFDPRTASDTELRRYGLPRRPHPEREPAAHRLWQKAFRQPLRFVDVELHERPPTPVRPRWPVAPDTGSGPLYWGGVFRETRIGTDFASPAIWAYTEFVVPEVYGVEPAGEVLNVAFWVGLSDDGVTNILQAGVSAVVEPGYFSNSVEWLAWTEWFNGGVDNPGKNIRGFPVAPGDTIGIVVCAQEDDLGWITMANLTRGVGIGVPVDPPMPGITLGAYQVAWVVEAPPGTPSLAVFAPVTFTECTAATAAGTFHLEPGGDIVEIVNGDNVPLTRSTILSPTEVTVEWLDFR
jgi:hypothetical protein